MPNLALLRKNIIILVFSASLFCEVVFLFAEVPYITNHTPTYCTLQVCADGDRVRLLESPRLGDSKTSRDQRVETGRRNREDGDAERNRREEDRRGATATSTHQGDPSSWWVTDIPAARDCHQQNVEAIQVQITGCYICYIFVVFGLWWSF